MNQSVYFSTDLSHREETRRAQLDSCECGCLLRSQASWLCNRFKATFSKRDFAQPQAARASI